MPSFTAAFRSNVRSDASLAPVYKQLAEETLAPAAWRQQAKDFLAQGDAERCRLVGETLLQTAPSDIAAYLLLGEAALHEQPPRHEAALTACRRAYQLAADHGAAMQSRAACALGVALARKARCLRLAADKRIELRDEALNVMLSAVPDCPNPRTLATLQYNIALCRAEQGDVQQALASARTALETAQKLTVTSEGGETSPQGQQDGEEQESLAVSCVLLVATLLTARQQLPSALAVLSVLDPPAADDVCENGHLQASLGQQVLAARLQAGVLTAQGDTAAAVTVLTHCKKAVTASRGATAQLWQELAVACARSGSVADACFCAEQALQIEPWSAASHCAAGWAHEAAGRYLRAQDSYCTALSLDPHHPTALLRQSVLVCKAGTLTQLSAGRDLISDALRLEPRNPVGWYQLGMACRAMQHTSAAEKNLKTAMLLAATSPVIPFRAKCVHQDSFSS